MEGSMLVYWNGIYESKNQCIDQSDLIKNKKMALARRDPFSNFLEVISDGKENEDKWLKVLW